MVPQQPDPPSDPSDVSDPRLASTDLGDIRPILAALTQRIASLEAEVRHLTESRGTTAVPAPPAINPQEIYPQETYPQETYPQATYGALQAEISGEARPSDPKPPLDIPSPPPPRSLEDRLGSQIFNRIGIVALLIGATWFLKLAMDNHWIGPLGRVLIGLIAGAGIVVWSERFRRREFAAFSYSLKAVGTGVLYLSLWASFQLYSLIPPEIAFGLMLLVTAWNAWMAWSQQSEILAAYALSGGLATPILLSTGGNHQVFLFSYLLSLDIATLALVELAALRSKSWSRLLIASLSGTIVYFVGWYVRFYTLDQLGSTSLFITLFFLAFFTVPFRFTSGDPETKRAADPISDVLLPLTNAAFASVAFYVILAYYGHRDSLPWISILFSGLYLAAMRLSVLVRRQTTAARAVHLTLAVLFLTIAIPLKARGLWIVTGWLAEGVALLWVSARLSAGDSDPAQSDDQTSASVHQMLRRLAALALALGFCGLLIAPDWIVYDIHPAFFNRRFATDVAGIGAFAIATWIALRALKSASPSDRGTQLKYAGIFPTWLQVASISIVALNLIAVWSVVIEIYSFWAQGLACPYCPEVATQTALKTALSISAYLMLYGAGLLTVGFWKHSAFLRWQGLILLIIAILKTFIYDVRDLSQGYRVASFLGLGALLMAVSFAYVRRNSKPAPTKES